VASFLSIFIFSVAFFAFCFSLVHNYREMSSSSSSLSTRGAKETKESKEMKTEDDDDEKQEADQQKINEE
jgi:hypothetical protein